MRKHILILKQKLWLCIWLSGSQIDSPSFCGWARCRQPTNPGANTLRETEIQLWKSLSAGGQSACCAHRDHDSVGLPQSGPGVSIEDHLAGQTRSQPVVRVSTENQVHRVTALGQRWCHSSVIFRRFTQKSCFNEPWHLLWGTNNSHLRLSTNWKVFKACRAQMFLRQNEWATCKVSAGDGRKFYAIRGSRWNTGPRL